MHILTLDQYLERWAEEIEQAWEDPAIPEEDRLRVIHELDSIHGDTYEFAMARGFVKS